MRGAADFPVVQGRAPGSPLDPSSFWRRRPLFWLTLAFILGIALDAVFEPSRPAIGGFCAASLLALLGALLAWPKEKRPGVVLMIVALFFGVAGGLFRHALESRFLAANDVASRTPAGPSLAWIEGTVNEVRRSNTVADHAWWTVELSTLGASPEELTPVSGRVQLGVSLQGTAERIGEGDRIRTFARLESPAAATLPSGFDAAAYLEQQGIRRVGVPSGNGLSHAGHAPWWRIDLWLRRLSAHGADRNTRLWGTERAALSNALLLGRREAIDPDDRRAFQNLGTAHLLSISGLHLQMLAVFVWWVLGCMGCSKRRAGWAVLLFSAAYAAIAGAQPPVVRSALMVALYLGGRWLYRAIDPLTVIAATALLILLHHPSALFDAGFQLSFMAVLSLIAIYPTLEAAWRVWRGFPEEWVRDPDELVRLKIARWLRQSLFISLAAWMGTAPLVAWHMGNFSLLAVLANLVVVPLTGVAMLGGLISLVAGPGWIGEIGQIFPTLLLGFNRWASGFSWTGWEIPRPSAWLLLAYAGVWVWVWVGRGRTAVLPRLALMVSAAVLALAASGWFREGVTSPRLTVLDVARGRAALVETPGGDAVLLDCGGEGTGRTLSEFLRREGHRGLALLVITEDSPDALGGAAELVERLPVRRAILPRSAAPSSSLRAVMTALSRRETPYDLGSATGTFSGPGDLRWTFFADRTEGGEWPGSGSEALGIRVQWAGASAVFAPVRSRASVRRLMAQAGDSLRCDVLRLYGNSTGRWPEEAEALIRRSEARTLVAGEGAMLPDESTGLDVAALARSRDMRLLSPRREGSLRFGDGRMDRALAYRQGTWKELGP